ncbi:LysR substrate-binding domain-containing protein, partial [Rhodococcus sp. NPDC127593]
HVRSDGADPEWVRWWACDPRPSGRPVIYGPSVRTMDEMLEVVASGAAIVITSKFVDDTRRHEGVVFVPVRDAPRSAVCLCTRRDDLSAGTRALIDGATEFRDDVL